MIVGNESPAPGPFDRRTMPLLTSVINSIVDERYERVVITAATQSGKSLVGNQIPMAYFLHYQRRNTAFGVPNRKLAARVYHTKLRPMIQATPDLAELFGQESGAGSRGGFPTEQILRNGAVWLFLGAGSDSDMSQATVHDLIVDETDKADAEGMDGKEAMPIEQMIRRTDAHQLDRRLIFTCTPTTERGYIWQAYRQGTEGKPHFRCLGCGGWFWFAWDWAGMQLGWDDDSTELTAMATSYYACPICERRIRETERLALLRYPLWVHTGEQIAPCSLDEAQACESFAEAAVIGNAAFRVTGERKQTRTVSWWWNRLCSPFTSLGHLAAAVRSAREDQRARKAVTIYDMARPSSDMTLDSSELTIEEVLDHQAYSDYREGRLPIAISPQVLVTAGVDLGGRRMHYVIDAWVLGERGSVEASYRIEHPDEWLYPSELDPMRIYRALEWLRSLALRGWQDAVGATFRPRICVIDCGYQDARGAHGRAHVHDKQVMEFCRRYGQATWRAARGMTRPLEGRHPYAPKRTDDGGVLWWLDTDALKVELHEQIRIKPGQRGYWHLHRNTTRYYARSLCAERRIVSFGDDNEERAEWVREDRENHLWDASVYSWAGARMLGARPPLSAGAREEKNEEETE